MMWLKQLFILFQYYVSQEFEQGSGANLSSTTSGASVAWAEQLRLVELLSVSVSISPLSLKTFP